MGSATWGPAGATGAFHLRAGIPRPTAPCELPAVADVLIVGGGIYGAWTALEAALRGLRVVLCERRTWASGTSSASSKLIHGGLRYLEHGDVSLVRKALCERARLLRLAPHRVHPLRFVVPVTRRGRLTRAQLYAGLWLYDTLAGELRGVERHAPWSRAALLAAAPFLDREELLGGFTYGDAGTDDAALTRDVVAAAQAAGAVCSEHTEVSAVVREGGAVVGVALSDGHVLRAPTTVLSAGPWAFALAGLDPQQAARFTKGVHLVLPPVPFPQSVGNPLAAHDSAFLLTSPVDGRVFFLIPWQGGTMVGTTDTDFSGTPDSVRVEVEDVRYLLTAVAATCPGLGWRERDIRNSWVGLRTLQRGAASASALTREWELRRPEPGLLLPVGGKLTSARVEAVHIVEALAADVVPKQ
jgi:glycerol-3-phosphate dehydrogenase